MHIKALFDSFASKTLGATAAGDALFVTGTVPVDYTWPVVAITVAGIIMFGIERVAKVIKGTQGDEE